MNGNQPTDPAREQRPPFSFEEDAAPISDSDRAIDDAGPAETDPEEEGGEEDITLELKGSSRPALTAPEPDPSDENGTPEESRAIPEPPTAEDHYRLGRRMSGEKRPHEAVEAYRLALGIDPMHVKARNNLALVYDSLGLFEKALEELRTAVDIDPRNVELRANLGALLGEHGCFDEAEREFRRALEAAPADARIHFNLGLVYFRKGLYLKAIPEFERTLSLDENHREGLFYLAQSYNLTGRYPQAVAMFERLIVLEPDNHRAFWYLGILYDRQKDHEKAREYYQISYRLRDEAGEESDPAS